MQRSKKEVACETNSLHLYRTSPQSNQKLLTKIGHLVQSVTPSHPLRKGIRQSFALVIAAGCLGAAPLVHLLLEEELVALDHRLAHIDLFFVGKHCCMGRFRRSCQLWVFRRPTIVNAGFWSC
jgi:hypothetical protein